MRPLWPPLFKRDIRVIRTRAHVQAEQDSRRQSRIPLSHHDIIALAEPFTRSGRQVDLAASDRLARRIQFKPTHHRAETDGATLLTEHLVLEHLGRRHFRLTRILTNAAGQQATLRGDGPEPGRLLVQIDRVPVARHVQRIGGATLVINYRIESDSNAPAEPSDTPHLVFLQATTTLDGLVMTFDAQVGHGMPAEIDLAPDPERSLDLPPDLFAVLGRAWRPLRRTAHGWRAPLRIASNEPARTPDLEAKLARTTEHLIDTFAHPPAHFHTTWRRERWFAFLREAIGLLLVIGLFLLGPALLLLDASEGSLIRLLSFVMPALLVLFLIARHESPVMRIPPRPEPLPADAW
ncbi:hypothetical protein CKO25_16875 [Thiocapsa imhoffii]|uniref:Uncharacterized protein n=2 Tax=Thiocapsa imhoffii TaxID=382777 RepID=A0A9X0WKB4_9GAMM|nr:hypothetical protein [Thiocapsa imhoffii]